VGGAGGGTVRLNTFSNGIQNIAEMKSNCFSDFHLAGLKNIYDCYSTGNVYMSLEHALVLQLQVLINNSKEKCHGNYSG